MQIVKISNLSPSCSKEMDSDTSNSDTSDSDTLDSDTFYLNLTPFELFSGDELLLFFSHRCPLSRQGRPNSITTAGPAFSAPGQVFLGHLYAQMNYYGITTRYFRNQLKLLCFIIEARHSFLSIIVKQSRIVVINCKSITS